MIRRVFVGRLPTKEVADEQSAAEEHQQPRDGARLKPGNFRKREGYVRERAEHAAKAQNRHQMESQTAGFEGTQFATEALGLLSTPHRHHQRDTKQCKHSYSGDGPERRTPTKVLAEESTERNAKDVGSSKSSEHDGNGTGLLRAGTVLAATTEPIPKNAP